MLSISSAGHGREVTAPFVGFNQHLVGNDVELLRISHVSVVAALSTLPRRLRDGLADAASPCHHFEQQQLGGMWPSTRCCSTTR
jgi:hypothetical protein